MNLSNELDKIMSGVSGPKILLLGATHGNEPVGVDAWKCLKEMFVADEFSLVNGEVHFLEVNPMARKMGVRFIEHNMNRIFTDSLPESVEGQRASAIREFFKANKYDYVLDAHSVSVGEFSMFINFSDDSVKEARVLNKTPILLDIRPEHIRGSICEEAIKNNAKAFAVECGNHVSPNAIKVFLSHIFKLLSSQGMVESIPDKFIAKDVADVVHYKVFDKIAPYEGMEWVVPNVETGLGLKKGQVFATNNAGIDTIAEQDCYMLMPSKVPDPNDEDAGFLAIKV